MTDAIRNACQTAARFAAVLMLAALAVGQGIDLKPRGLVLFGSAAATSRPAAIDFKRVTRATPEWRTIRAEAVRTGSGRYELLVADMNERIRAAVVAVAEAEKRDCVIRRRDLKDARGANVVNLTTAVIRRLR